MNAHAPVVLEMASEAPRPDAATRGRPIASKRATVTEILQEAAPMVLFVP
jgi:hypothetical protein